MKTLATKPQLVSSHLNKWVAFQAKYDGRPYSEIAQRLEVPVSTLTTYFSREWKHDYGVYAKQETEYRLELARAAARSQLPNVVRALLDLTHASNERVKLEAIKYFLGLTVGENFFSMIDEPEVTLVEKISVEKRTKTR